MKTIKEWRQEVNKMQYQITNWGTNNNKRIRIGRYVVVILFFVLIIWLRSR